jgi:hypothetical protein
MPIVSAVSLEYKITNVNIDAANLTIQLVIAQSFNTNGVITTINTIKLDINHADTQLLVLQAPAGATLYDSLKTALYQYLISKGLYPGTVR